MNSADLHLPARRSAGLVFALLTLLFLASCVPVSAQTASASGEKPQARIARLLSQLESVRTFRQVALSPDGRQIAWVVDAPSGHSRIELAEASTPAVVRQISAVSAPDSCNEGQIAWSPDGQQLAFLSDCDSSRPVADLPGWQQRQVTLPTELGNLQGIVDSLQWSPNGKSLGFLYVEGGTRSAGALDAMKPPSGVIGEDGLEIQRVAAMDAGNGALRMISPASLHVYEFDWSPGSDQIAYVAAAPPGENNWWIAQLYTQALGSQPHSILDPNQVDTPLHGLQLAVPRWSPDGKQIALIGGLMSDQGSTGGDIYVLPAAGGPARNLTPGLPTSPAWLHWESDTKLAFTEIASGTSRWNSIDISTGTTNDDATAAFSLPEHMGSGDLEMSLSVAKDGTVALLRSSFTKPPEVWTWSPNRDGHFTQITHVNEALKSSWGTAQPITWTSDTFHVDGWLLQPANYDPAKKYALVVYVHGGPASAVVPSWPSANFGAAPFSAMDYFVLLPNPRGSYGQGEAFAAANRKDFGYGDLRDILAGVDAVEAKYPIDGTRVGITGWSYGGFMTMFAVTQTNRFRAAVAGAGISNWQSYYGQNSIDQWMIPYFGASVYDDPAAYSKSSAINFIHKAKAPTLLVVGDRDGECPAPQSFEFWHALKAQHVPTKLVVYANEGHRFASPDHRRDVLDRALEWFEQYMPAEH